MLTLSLRRVRETVALLRAVLWMPLPYTWHIPGEEAVGLPPFSVEPIACTCSPEAAKVMGKFNKVSCKIRKVWGAG